VCVLRWTDRGKVDTALENNTCRKLLLLLLLLFLLFFLLLFIIIIIIIIIIVVVIINTIGYGGYYALYSINQFYFCFSFYRPIGVFIYGASEHL